MPVKFGFNNPYLLAWLLIHQAYNLVLRCENNVFSKYSLSAEQHSVLMAMKYIKSPVTPTAIAHWLDRNPNSISLIVERMAKAGLVKGTRDLRDRRSVRLVITKKGKEIHDKSTIAGWQLIQEILSTMKEEEIRTLIQLLGKVRDKSFEYLNPKTRLDEIKVNEDKNMTRFLQRVSKYTAETPLEELKSNHATKQPKKTVDGL